MIRQLAALCALVLFAGCQGSTIDLNKRLARGVNLQLAGAGAHQGEAAGHFKMPAKSDLRLIHKLGLGHVRIRVNPTDLMDGSTLNQTQVKQLHKLVNRIRGQGLSVILTTQPSSDFKASLKPSSRATSHFANFWRALAVALNDIPPGTLVFEPLNEPETKSAQDWQSVQELLVGAIRAGAPNHRIIVAGHRFSSIPELVEMQPLPYSNLLYSFHFYDPHNFTHQGANWGWPMWQYFHDWPYPSSPQAVAPLISQHVPKAREHLRYYGQQAWDKAKLAEQLDRAVDWAKANNVELICTEFGAYRDGIQPRYRLAWLRDVVGLLQAHNIDWTLWDYAGNFGIVSGTPGERELDTDAVTALGLNAL